LCQRAWLLRLTTAAAAFCAVVRACPSPFSWALPSSCEELAQNGVRREAVPNPFGGVRRTLCASKSLAAVGSMLQPQSIAVIHRKIPATPFALLRDARKTERGAGFFLIGWISGATTPFALVKRLDPPRGISTRGGYSRKMQPSANVLHGRRIRHADVPSDGQPSEHRAAEALPICRETRRKPPRPSDDNRLAKHTLDQALYPESRRSGPAAQSEPLPPRRR
jgi:hypothetical protein